MLDYAVIEISGRQYKVTPHTVLAVDYLGDIKNFHCETVLLRVEDGKLILGTPFLKDKLLFEVIDHKKLAKVRVATYKAKANYRRVRGSRRRVSMIELKLESET